MHTWDDFLHKIFLKFLELLHIYHITPNRCLNFLNNYIGLLLKMHIQDDFLHNTLLLFHNLQGSIISLNYNPLYHPILKID